jgi:hypothetical protein
LAATPAATTSSTPTTMRALFMDTLRS